MHIPGYKYGYIIDIPGYIPGHIYNGIPISHDIYHMYLLYIYRGPNKNTLDPLQDGINLSIKVPKGSIIWHPTV